MKLRVEFFGIARQRAGVAGGEITLASEQATLGAALVVLEKDFPGLAGECIAGGHLQQGLSANLDGERFVSDPATILGDRDCLLLLSADAGG
jgi:hypothetical protein